MANRETYRARALRVPQLDDVRALSKEMNFRCTEEELVDITKILGEMTVSLEGLNQLPDTSVPIVKYPRTPGYKPRPEDNPYNGWAWKCDIRGTDTGKLSGKTVAIKDNVAVAGVPMQCGSKVMEGYVPEFDATVVTRILDAGGRILGKSATEDLTCGGSSILSCDGPVRNPVDETRVSGGSSSGSAALVAGGIVDMAIGSDQGGSIRIPAGLTGIVGLKPTHGLVPYTGAMVVEPTIDHLGPMAKTVKDCALLLEVIAGFDDGRDPRQLPGVEIPEYSKLIDASMVGKKVGLLKEGFDACPEDVQSIVRNAAFRLKEAGVNVRETSVAMHKESAAIHSAIAGFGNYNGLIKCSGGGAFAKGFYPLSMQEAFFRGYRSCPFDLSPRVKTAVMFGKYIDRHYGTRFYAKGQNLLMELTKAYDMALEEFDALILPTGNKVAPKIPPADVSTYDLIKHVTSFNTNTKAFNDTGHPALSINAVPGTSSPAAADEESLPLGMTIVGKKFDDLTVLQIARAFEKLTSGQ